MSYLMFLIIFILIEKYFKAMKDSNSYLNALPLDDNDKVVISKIRELRQLRSGLRELIENNKDILTECGIFLETQIDKINNKINILKHYKP